MSAATITHLAAARRVKTTVRQDATTPGVWRVEAVDYSASGTAQIAVFVGGDAETRAREYALWKYRLT
ncbi:hypothetical protein RUR49_10570 [Pseudoxanthobacter sp. M-2]|uniref:hypothetical protein n=1 Tax=Pseudoxanthobacter sp. M-2 TaxID=3078754 RepID=UPI0038FCAE58